MDISVVSDTVIYRLEDELSKKILDQMPKERVLILEGTGKVLKVLTHSLTHSLSYSLTHLLLTHSRRFLTSRIKRRRK